MKEAKFKKEFRFDIIGVVILYLIGCLAGYVNMIVGVAAFVCITILLTVVLLVNDRHGKEKE